MAVNWKPHPPPFDHWPDHVKAIYAAGCAKIDRLRVQMEPDGVCPIPFVCYLCEQSRDDFAMLTGDGLPLCVKCLGFRPHEPEPEGIPT